MASDFVPQLLSRDLSADDSPDPTQAFPPGYVEGRLETFPRARQPRVGQPSATLDWTTLSRDPKSAELEGARMLLYPKVKGLNIGPYNGTGQYGPWVDVKMKDKSGSASVLVVAPGPEDIGCTIFHHDAVCRFFFDPAQDYVVFYNNSFRPFTASKPGSKMLYPVSPNQSILLSLGIWDLTFDGESLMEVQVLKRRDWLTRSSLSVKRSAPADESPCKKLKTSDGRGITLSKSPLAVSGGNALVKLEKGMRIRVGSLENGYWLTHLGTILENQQTSVWRAKHSSAPGKDIVVKVTKASRGEKFRINVAKRWIQEYTIHGCFDHPSIVKLLGMDARFHSLYLEYIDAKTLSDQINSEAHFTGNYEDALRIMENLASALSHVHSKKIVHGDVKPGNVLYNHARGAVLIDFGLSFPFVNSVVSKGCGTPWYLPPEYLENSRLEGPESDIWALGVVMLWLLGYIRLPEKTFKGWQVADIIPGATPTGPHEAAIQRMDTWINFITGQRAKFLLRGDTELALIVGKALNPERAARIDAASLTEQLHKLRLTAPREKTDCELQNQSRDSTTHHGNNADSCSTQNQSHDTLARGEVGSLLTEHASRQQ
ncbi:kinase-like domain-containing protein [Xylaria sp. FL1777]|nr:kinase-like domain-containing protein [Xylaria sp. FL1777]